MWDGDGGVGFDEVEEHLRANVFEQVLDGVADEVVAHDLGAVRGEKTFKGGDVVALIGADEGAHGGDVGIVSVWFDLLRVKGIHRALHEHVGQDEVFEALHPTLASGFVVGLEGFEKISRRELPLALRHVHLSSALSNDARDARMGNGRGDL